MNYTEVNTYTVLLPPPDCSAPQALGGVHAHVLIQAADLSRWQGASWDRWRRDGSILLLLLEEGAATGMPSIRP